MGKTHKQILEEIYVYCMEGIVAREGLGNSMECVRFLCNLMEEAEATGFISVYSKTPQPDGNNSPRY